MGWWDGMSIAQKGTVMKEIFGLNALIEMRTSLPQVGWIFVDPSLDKTSLNHTLKAKFYVSENEEDDFFGEDNLMTWLEVPTFEDVLTLREKNIRSPTTEQYAQAAIHYIEMDDFLD
jgi:hypothetical protein